MYRILIVEDDAVIASEIGQNLKRWGLEPHAADDFSDIMGVFEKTAPHLILMDISLPFFNGFYWCAEIRKKSKVPVIFLSSRSDNMDIVMAVNMGGDDYIAKPVSMEVADRQDTGHAFGAPTIMKHPICYPLSGALLDGALCLVHNGARTELTRNEARILQLLLTQKGSVVSREQLMLALWDSDEFVDDNTLTVNVNHLRKTA